MYSREVGDRVLEFGVSGKLVMNVLVMYDRQTESLWSQLLGKAIEGPLKGITLEFLPAWQTTWLDWRTRYPDTKALIKGYVGRRDPYLGYYNSGRAGVLGQERQDDRLPIKQFVIGIANESNATAYPFSILNDEPVVNDWVGDLPVLVVFDPENASGVVFDRRAGDETLDFDSLEGFRLIDRQSSSIWDGKTGEAISGQMSGVALERVKSTSSFWFGWKDFYPDTRVYGVDE